MAITTRRGRPDSHLGTAYILNVRNQIANAVGVWQVVTRSVGARPVAGAGEKVVVAWWLVAVAVAMCGGGGSMRAAAVAERFGGAARPAAAVPSGTSPPETAGRGAGCAHAEELLGYLNVVEREVR